LNTITHAGFAPSSSVSLEPEVSAPKLGFVIGLDLPAIGARRNEPAKALDTIVAFYSKAL
jgi:hypothetical protein